MLASLGRQSVLIRGVTSLAGSIMFSCLSVCVCVCVYESLMRVQI